MSHLGAHSITELIDLITLRHHAAVRQRLLQIDGLIRQSIVFPATPEARRFAARYERFRRDLLGHLEGEESVVFPAFLAFDRLQRNADDRSPLPLLPAMDEHAQGERDLRDVIALAIRLPDGNKPLLMATLRDALAAMADDYTRHRRDEDERLLPAVAAARDAISARREAPSVMTSDA